MIRMPYHTDDFYQKMLDLGERSTTMSFKMNSGKCHGGPLDGKKLHHPEPSYQVAIDPYPGRGGPRTIPGMVASADPDVIRFGVYRFTDGMWTWHP